MVDCGAYVETVGYSCSTKHLRHLSAGGTGICSADFWWLILLDIRIREPSLARTSLLACGM
jgi:hypothetical protein